jgi:small-conductance mechanosensitive channel
MDYGALSDTVRSIFSHAVVQVIGTIIIAIVLQLVVRATIGRVVRRLVGGYEVHGKKLGKKYGTHLDEEKREHTLVSLFRTAAAVAIWLIAIIVILWQLNINLAALMTGAGLIGIIVGFGAQSAIRDFLAGIFIIAENQYRVGDIVTLHTGSNDISGVVEDITIRITRLRDLDGNMHIVQNGSPIVVTNLTFDYANVNVDVSVAYESDVDKVEKVMNQVGQDMAEDDEWKEHIVEPIQFLRVDGFEDSAVRIKALGKVEPAKQWDVAGEFRRRIKRAFEKNGIQIPFPQVVVHNPKS